MDFERHQAASSSSSHTQATPSSLNANHSDRTSLRSSSRLKAAKEKEKEKEKEKGELPAEQPSRRGRDNTGKGKGKDLPADSPSVPARSSKRTRRATLPPTASAFLINEPAKDSKGKKRAAPESISEDESTPSSSKKIRSSHTSRIRKDSSSQMPKNSRSMSKAKGGATKGKAVAAPGPSRPSLLEDNIDMMDVDYSTGIRNDEDSMHGEEDQFDEAENVEKNDDSHQHDEDEKQARPPPTEVVPPNSRPSVEESMALIDFGRLGGYMSQLNTRLRTLLNNIKPSADPSTKLIALQELSELLGISTEDTLAGSFQVESFVKELVRILGGTGGEAAQDDVDDDNESNDEDAALAAALQMSTGGTLPGDENLEAQLLACRCLANLMEALPGCGHTLVYHGAIPVLCNKLLEISYIDLAEQTLLTLEKISEEYPSAIVREGGLAALLNFLDFFSIAVQRTALQAAANCLRNASPDNFSMIKDVWPIIRNCLGYADQRLVDFAALCVIRVIESYYRSHADKLEVLVDADLIRAVNMLLLPAGGSPVVPVNTFTLLIRSLATAARASATITVTLLQADIVTTLYQILTGVLPPQEKGEVQGDSVSNQGLGGRLADMAVMQNLAHRPKEQIEEALTLVQELMPPLPKDGTFDHRGYSEKALHRMMKSKARADRMAARAAAAGIFSSLPGGQSPLSSRAHTPTGGPSTPGDDEHSIPANEAPEGFPVLPMPIAPGKETAIDRAVLLHQHSTVVNRFISLMVPILVDVYAASVSVPVRIKSLASLLKAICFQDEEHSIQTLKNVPIASFTSSILSSKDHPNLMIGGLQMVELLLCKTSADYKASFRREGVLHEIEILAARPLSPRTKDKEKEKVKEEAKDPVSITPEIPEAAVSRPASSSSRRAHLLDPEDAYTLRARVIRFRYLSSDGQAEGDAIFVRLRNLVEVLKRSDATDKQLRETLQELANLFSSPHTTVSSFELLQSGLVDALLEFITSKNVAVDLSRRQRLFLEELAPCKGGKPLLGPSPLGVLVKKLQESLTRMETFEVTTVSPGIEDTKRNSPSLLARQIRLRLISEEGSEAPRGGSSNIVVSIHAIATFQALNDYLRPRLSGLLSSIGGSRFQGMLAALTAGRFPPDALLGASSGLPGSSSQLSLPPMPANTNNTLADARPERRRSLRLSAKASASSLSEKANTQASSSSEAGAPPSVASTSTVAVAPPGKAISNAREELSGEVAGSETIINDDEDGAVGDFMDADVDAEVFEDDLDDDSDGSAEKTVTLSVAPDGSKVEAQTPDGTRVATPNPSADPISSLSTQKPSYAAALKNKSNDWHLEFTMDGHVLPLDMTIYGAVHQHEERKSPGGTIPSNMIWQGVYTVKYKKITGPRLTPETDPPSRARSPISPLTSLTDEASHSKILNLLRALHKLNADINVDDFLGAHPLPETAFINNKLTAKLTRQLEEPMIVASACLPEWAMDLPLHFPFLFPFSTRFSFLQSTSFGYARLILKWQSQSRAQESSRRDDTFGFLGRLQRQKVRISRKHILESAFKVFELYGSSSSILEVEYFDEVGTGLGPTLEFYSMVSKEFARRDLKIWRDADTTHPGVYVLRPTGLFPAPVGSLEGTSDGGEKRTYVFRIIGQFVAKAMLDSRIIDMTFNKIFLKMILGEEVPLTIATLRHIDPTLANSLMKLQAFVKPSASNDVKMETEIKSIEDLMLDFTLPGYDIELRPGGRDIAVTTENVQEYIREVLDVTIGKGVEFQAKAFREGFSKVFPVFDLQAFSAEELGIVFGSADEDWSFETLMEAMKADHGFNVESPTIRNLASVMAEYDASTRRKFLQFITGSPKLPIGGFRSLNPPLTVVRKPHEAPLTADDYLPSVMTCVNYLKLPQYSSKTVLRQKLETAMMEGVGSFHLS
ncbi:hypothetical protein EW145_g739 [Phellinidium pouzarii]|uniref:HECT-type E3 ubiquitin transferase n=1 Tax=Phellinidium pouzarii TaxID=167371 RepID=A0A4S4LHU0_9AGAM|nr:hypothetical protein EW145_g739 [Phellinidium pouzarii]